MPDPIHSLTVPPPCTLSGYGVRVRAGADYRAGGVAGGAGEKKVGEEREVNDNVVCSCTFFSYN